jgi:integrase
MSKGLSLEVPGLIASPMRARGERDGRLYWRARTTDGIRRTVWTGWATRPELVLVLADLVRQGIPAPHGDRGPVRTVGDLLVRWTRHQEQRRAGGQIAERSLAVYRTSAGYWRAALDDVLVQALTRQQVEDTIVDWLADGVAPRTCRVATDALAAAVRWGTARGHCPPVDLSRLARVLEAMSEGWQADVVRLLALTGARIGEVVALRVGDWDRIGGALVLSGRDDERERRGKVAPRRWPVLPELEGALERMAGDRGPGERLVVGPAVHYDVVLSDHIRAACVAAEVERFTPHGIRRRVAMDLLDGGVDARTVSELTGHSVQVLLRSYVRPTPDRLRAAVLRTAIGVEGHGQVVPMRRREDG